jgi:hypothetical protein
MLGIGAATRFYLAIGATDMRKGFEGVFGIVRDRLLIDPLSGHLFVFCNARKNRLKILYWDGKQRSWRSCRRDSLSCRNLPPAENPGSRLPRLDPARLG